MANTADQTHATQGIRPTGSLFSTLLEQLSCHVEPDSITDSVKPDLVHAIRIQRSVRQRGSFYDEEEDDFWARINSKEQLPRQRKDVSQLHFSVDTTAVSIARSEAEAARKQALSVAETIEMGRRQLQERRQASMDGASRQSSLDSSWMTPSKESSHEDFFIRSALSSDDEAPIYR